MIIQNIFCCANKFWEEILSEWFWLRSQFNRIRFFYMLNDGQKQNTSKRGKSRTGEAFTYWNKHLYCVKEDGENYCNEQIKDERKRNTSTCTHTHTHTHIYICVCVYIYIIHIYVYICVCGQQSLVFTKGAYYIYIYMYTHIYTYTYIYIKRSSGEN
jgi:hypothetical protein